MCTFIILFTDHQPKLLKPSAQALAVDPKAQNDKIFGSQDVKFMFLYLLINKQMCTSSGEFFKFNIDQNISQLTDNDFHKTVFHSSN